MDLKQLQRQFGVRTIGAPTTEFSPGAILKNESSNFYQPMGKLSSYLAGLNWNTTADDANLPAGNLEEVRKGGASIKVFGITIGGETSRANSIKVEVTRPTVVRFADISSLELMSKLKDLKASNKPKYKEIDEHWVLTHAWLAQDLRIEFADEAGAKVDVAVDRLTTSISAGASIERASKGVIQVTSGNTVPFAFWGFKI